MTVFQYQRVLVICTMIASAQLAHANFFSKGKSIQSQSELAGRVQRLEQYNQGLETKIKQLEEEIAAMRSAQIGEATQGSDLESNALLSRIKALPDEVEVMSQNIAKKDAGSVALESLADDSESASEAGLYSKITKMIQLRDYQKAQSFAQTYMQSFSSEKNASTVLFWLGEIKMLFGELVDAKVYYLKSLSMLKGKGRTPEILLKIAVISYQKGETEEGDRYYDQLQKIYPGSTASHMARAQRKKYRVESSD